jgi:hypothetical protein
MKEQIYTIPVTEAFTQGGECPFCNLYAVLEKDAVDYMLGPSYMEDDIRAETDKTGFCRKHYIDMYSMQNRLGLALMLHTHIKHINAQLSKAEIKQEKKSLFSKKETVASPIEDFINNISDSCYICNRINVTFERYFDTFFFMWNKKPEIKDFVKSGNGFCIEHFSKLISEGRKKLSPKDFDEFISIILPIQQENMKRIEQDVEWFINKFDYKYKDEPWKNSKDAIARGLTKVASISDVEQEVKK